MRVATTPVEIANTVAHNIVPLGGILFFGWSAPAVLVLYFADTIFAIAVMFAGLIRYFMPPVQGDGWAARANGEVAAVACALFTAAVFAVPLGMPVFIMLAGTGTTFDSLFADPAFRAGLVMQAIAAFWSGAGLYRALRTHTPDELRLKRRFALVFLRWVVVLMVAYTGIAFLFGGSFAPFVFVAVYIATSIFIDIAPDKFLSAFPGDARDATSPAAPAAAPPGKRRKRKR
jgi:hypothetical protein